MSVKLNQQAAITIAKDFTSLAIENNLIQPCENGEETAKEVLDFFNTLVESFTNYE